MSIEALYSKLQKSRPLRFDVDLEIESKTFQEFLNEEIFKYFFKYRTVTVKNKKHQCRQAAYRSIGNIYSVVKHYFPETTPQEFIKYFFGRKGEVKNFKDLMKYDISCHYCGRIRKRVYFTSRYKGGSIYYQERRDENKLTLYDYLNEATKL